MLVSGKEFLSQLRNQAQEYYGDMPPEERTRKASRRKMIERSKVDINYGRLHDDRRNIAITESQMDRIGGSYRDRPLIDGGHILAWWNVPVSVLANNRRARMRFWIIVVVACAPITLISIGLRFFA